MKKLITMLLAMGLLALLSLSTVAYADERGNNGNGDNGKKDDKTVVLCQEKDDEFKLIEVKKDDLEKYLEDDAFFPKAKVLEEEKDKATVKFLCDNGDNSNNNDDHVKVLLCQEKDDEFKLIEVKKDDLEKYLEDDAFFPKAKVLEEDEDKAIVKFLCDFDNGDDKDNKKTIYPYQADNDENGENGHKAAAIGIRQTALVV